MASELSEQEIVRRESLAKIREMGIDPYPAALFPVTHHAKDLSENFEEGKTVTIAGRLMSRRIMGKASFAEILDSSGRFQIYVNRDELCTGEDKSYYNDLFKRLLDLGDFIGVTGELFTTQVGEQSLLVKELTVLCKALKPLPLPKTDADGTVHDAFTDPELRYRQRYVDLVVNPDVKETFLARTRVFSAMREYINQFGYVEVETPILQPIPGGAAARPFISHHNALDIPLYLRIANELYLKRLIVGGFEGVYEFAKDFRNEGMDKTHNPEFTVMEIYVAYKDYNWMMEFTENMIAHVVDKVVGNSEVQVGEQKINFQPPFRRLSMTDAIKEYADFDISGKGEDELRNACKARNIEVDETMGVGKLIDELFGETCESHLIQPTFITDYPVEMSPLCKKHRDNPELTERFELIVNGKELTNAYSELNDPIDQRERFEDQLTLSEKGDDEAMFIDQDFLRALEYGMPPTSGMGIGMDRLVMMLTNNDSIQEVLFFPQMRPEKASGPKPVELNDNEKALVKLLTDNGNMELSSLKEASGLSNKQWDKSIKGLRGASVIDVVKTDDSLTVSLL